MFQIIYIIFGLAAGIFSGLFGVGGATILIPAMVFFLGMTQHQAQGTALAAMVPPIGLLAAIRYWQSGNVNIPVAAFICIGFFIGGYIGANFVQNIPEPLLKKMFGIFLLIVSLNMIIGK